MTKDELRQISAASDMSESQSETSSHCSYDLAGLSSPKYSTTLWKTVSHFPQCSSQLYISHDCNVRTTNLSREKLCSIHRTWMKQATLATCHYKGINMNLCHKLASPHWRRKFWWHMTHQELFTTPTWIIHFQNWICSSNVTLRVKMCHWEELLLRIRALFIHWEVWIELKASSTQRQAQI